MAKWEKLVQESEIPPGTRKVVPAAAMELLIINAGKRYYACANECPHLGEPLENGELQGHILRCSAHGYKMDLSDGHCVTEAGVDLPVFPIEVREGWIFVKL